MKLIYKSSHWDEEQQRILVFLTNHRSFAASTIAAVYRQRWQIELFFKALKQKPAHQELRRHQPNALQIQISTALIALLVLKYLQLRARFGWSLSNLAALLRQHLFVYRELWAWIDQPFQPSPLLDVVAEQIALFRQATWTAEPQPQSSRRSRGIENAPLFSISRTRFGLIWTAVKSS